jgi:single-strand DNA-binding protein
MNKSILVGRIVLPPRYEDTRWGPVMNIVVATTNKWKNSAGEIQESTQKIKASLWGKLAELNQGVQRGDLVSLEGRLQNKKVQDKNGVERWETEVKVNDFEVLLAGIEPTADEYEDAPPAPRRAPAAKPPVPSRAEQEFSDDDIPF